MQGVAGRPPQGKIGAGAKGSVAPTQWSPLLIQGRGAPTTRDRHFWASAYSQRGKQGPSWVPAECPRPKEAASPDQRKREGPEAGTRRLPLGGGHSVSPQPSLL